MVDMADLIFLMEDSLLYFAEKVVGFSGRNQKVLSDGLKQWKCFQVLKDSQEKLMQMHIR